MGEDGRGGSARAGDVGGNGTIVEVVCPVDGVVVGVERGPGQPVDVDTPVVTIRTGGALPMSLTAAAGATGKVLDLLTEVGREVEAGTVLARVTETGERSAGDHTDEELECTWCGAFGLTDGYVADTYEGHDATWVSGPMETGFFGPRMVGREVRRIRAFRCPSCSHLEFFASEIE